MFLPRPKEADASFLLVTRHEPGLMKTMDPRPAPFTTKMTMLLSRPFSSGPCRMRTASLTRKSNRSDGESDDDELSPLIRFLVRSGLRSCQKTSSNRPPFSLPTKRSIAQNQASWPGDGSQCPDSRRWLDAQLRDTASMLHIVLKCAAKPRRPRTMQWVYCTPSRPWNNALLLASG